MNSGNMNCRISFISKIISKTPFGETKKEDVIVFSCWAEFREQTLFESTKTIGTVYEETVSFGIRESLSNKIETNMKIQKKDQLYEIVKVIPDIKSHGLAIIYARKVS